jgi:hypothetical protein
VAPVRQGAGPRIGSDLTGERDWFLRSLTDLSVYKPPLPAYSLSVTAMRRQNRNADSRKNI